MITDEEIAIELKSHFSEEYGVSAPFELYELKEYKGAYQFDDSDWVVEVVDSEFIYDYTIDTLVLNIWGIGYVEYMFSATSWGNNNASVTWSDFRRVEPRRRMLTEWIPVENP